MTQLEFNVTDINAFTSWIKRFASVDKSLLLEIDPANSELLAKSHNEEKSVVKYSRISFSDLSFELKSKTYPDQRIKLGIYDINKVIKTLNQFSEGFVFTIKYEQGQYESGNEFAGKMIVFKNDSLKVGFICDSLNVFTYMTDEIFKERVCKIEEVISFDLKQEDLTRINNLCDLDKEYDRLEFQSLDQKVFARSKSFELLVGVGNGTTATLPMLKSLFNKVDIENYSVKFGPGRIVFNSLDNDSVIVLGELDLDQYDKEEKIEF